MCDDCGLVFTNPLPSAQDLADFYSPAGEWASRRLAAVEHVTDRSERRVSRSWRRLFDPIRDELCLTAPPAGARVLDFGCGTGNILDGLRACGWDTWGIEPSCDHAFRRHGRLEQIPSEPMFDLIIANHVLEHVMDPLDILRQLARASRMGRYLFVAVPRLDTLPINRDYRYVINGRAHVTAYTWTCLEGLLARTGWAPVAPPQNWLSIGAGRVTCARLQVLARRVDTPLMVATSPGDAARVAIRQYHAGIEGRPLLERAGFYRLAAQRAAKRRRRWKIGKSANVDAPVS